MGLVVSDNSTIGDSIIEEASEVANANNLNENSGDQVSNYEIYLPKLFEK